MPDMLLLLLLLQVAQLRTVLSTCSFGLIEGRWEHHNEEGSRWQLFDTDCGLRNLLKAYTQPANKQLPSIGILLLGDSVDEYMVGHMCQKLNGTKAGAHSDRHVLHTCVDTPGHVNIGQWYVPGVALSGPYHEHHRKVYTGAIPRSSQAMAAWKQQFGRPPDAIVLASNFWDLARVHDHEPGVFGHGHLPRSWLHGWQANFTQWVEHVRTLSPQALLMYHTSVYPNFAYHTGVPKLASLQNIEMINEINAAGRHASMRLGVAVVDAQKMGTGLVPPMYLQDDFHPGSKLNAEVFNVYLNLVLQHRSMQHKASRGERCVRSATTSEC